MFGFGGKAKLKKLAKELKGSSLKDVVERYADAETILPPSIGYDAAVAVLFDNNISDNEKHDATILVNRLKKIALENNLKEGSEKIYLAYSTFNSLRSYALDLTIATRLMSNETAIKYLFETWIEAVPAHYVIPVLFPAKFDGMIEDFEITDDMRSAMIDEFVHVADRSSNTLTAEEVIEAMVSGFAAENPYFRLYPL